ncbi:serpin (serine protease inhibitor) domain-containing protein [Phthorimaea operculella]|nr:serpin (serine protease inhibitor) domain-containing protein [Phthorimaea operculella]
MDSKIFGMKPEIEMPISRAESTPAPSTRRIRSTVTAENWHTTPTPPHASNSEIKLSNGLKIYKIITNISTNVTNRTIDKETKTIRLHSPIGAPEFYDSTSRTAPEFERVAVNNVIAKIPFIQQKFMLAIDEFERKYYAAALNKLLSISPSDRRENGISFVLSGSFLFLILSALSVEVGGETRAEIDSCLGLDASDEEKIKIIKYVLDELPPSSDVLKFHWSTRLIVNGSWHPTRPTEKAMRLRVDRLEGNETPEQLMKTLNHMIRWSTRLMVNGSWHPTRPTEKAMRLRVDKLEGNETPEQLMKTLNHMVEADSGGAMRNTFEEDELSDGVRAVLINTLYVRARWRTAPTLLNGTHAFRDAEGAPQRTARMVRVNDLVRYADLPEWDAQAVEIPYATPELSLLLLVPRGRYLRNLTEVVSNTSLNEITTKMQPLRVAVTLPIFTLRMTMLLPNKLQAMGISRLVDQSNTADGKELRLSHAVQRLMFWAEAGRNAFKDDGIEWDPRPDMEINIDRPYIFYVRWRKFTLLNGNFVL